MIELVSNRNETIASIGELLAVVGGLVKVEPLDDGAAVSGAAIQKTNILVAVVSCVAGCTLKRYLPWRSGLRVNTTLLGSIRVVKSYPARLYICTYLGWQIFVSMK
jgi:hypothetical protein